MALNLSKLNPNQRQAVLHPRGPLLILAGAGSGKTSTMSYRIAHLVADRHVPPSAILGLSFTNKAAKELRERVKDLIAKNVGRKGSKGLTVTTFHSLCARILREHAERIGFQKNFSIVDTGDQKDVLKEIFRNLRIDDRKFDHDVLLSEISGAKNKLMNSEQASQFFLESIETRKMKSDYAIAAAEAFPKYQEKLKLLNAMDFDDLMYHTVSLLESCEDVRAHYNARFMHILVDEYQDTNPTQFRILRLLTQRYQNICVVGDDDQSIYSWRGADATHILEFASHYDGAQTVVLDQNYRSTSKILEAANAVIRNNSKRHPKSLWSDRGEGEPIHEVILDDDREESEHVAAEIHRRGTENQRPWKDFAVLYRSNAQSRVFEEALRRYKIPYRIVGGQSFLDRKEVKNVLCYWRLVVNPADDASLRRVINWPARGIGKSSIEALSDHAFRQGISLFEALGQADLVAPRASAGAAALRAQILGLQQEVTALSTESQALADWARRSLAKLEIKKVIDEEQVEDPAQAARRWENVEELVHALGQTALDPEDLEADGAEQLTATGLDVLREMLARMALDAQEEEDGEDPSNDDNRVTLLTLHGAKGLEYPVVFLVGCEEGFMPHKRTIEEATDFSEERRLAYVGITRARDLLLLTRAKSRIRFGKPVPRLRSRFLDEIPKDLLLLVDKSFPDETSSEEAREAHEQRVSDHLAKIREMMTKSRPAGYT